MLLVSAAALFVLTRLGPQPAPAAALRPLAGEVHAGGRLLPEEGAAVELRRGEHCRTGANARAHLELRAASAQLGPATSLRLEDARAARLGLERGELLLQGPCTVVSPLGVVELGAGWARVRHDAASLEVQALAGEVWLSDSRGRERVRAGERLRMPRGD